MSQATNILITENDTKEINLINKYASLTGLKPTTALKMFLRERLPAKIAEMQNKCQALNGYGGPQDSN